MQLFWSEAEGEATPLIATAKVKKRQRSIRLLKAWPQNGSLSLTPHSNVWIKLYGQAQSQIGNYSLPTIKSMTKV